MIIQSSLIQIYMYIDLTIFSTCRTGNLVEIFPFTAVLQVGLPILKQELSSVHIPDISGSTHVNVVGKVEYSLKKCVHK